MHYGHRPGQWCEGAALADEKPQDATALHPPKPKIHDEIAEVESVASSGVSGLYLVNSPPRRAWAQACPVMVWPCGGTIAASSKLIRTSAQPLRRGAREISEKRVKPNHLIFILSARDNLILCNGR